MIETYLLEALVAFNKYKTLSSAAEEIHISQPALSRSMQKLEDILGVSLFDRSKNKITLNDTGKLAASLAERILDQENEMVQLVRNFDSSLHTISIGYSTPGPMMEVPSLINRLYPDMAVSSDMQDEETILKSLRNKKYNMIISTKDIKDIDLISIPYDSERLYISLVPAHPAVAYKDQGLYFKDVNGETFLMSAKVGVWEEIVRKKMPDSKFLLQNDLDSLSEVVNSSSLASFASDLTIRLFRAEENPSRIFIPFNDKEAVMNYYCIILKENEEKLDKWIDFVKEK
ncbi:MAG: LysR family transcriptional regulator [Erysipelotrichaceae bacterium]|nr:LysR family transcriptional regulator [Erysipelotrichaceae bacterium]